MILPYHEGHLFFTLLDMVTVYAHQRLSVVSDADFFDDAAPRGIGEAGQRETLAELWHHVDLLDSFVQENPANLTQGELDIVTSWKDAYTHHFYVDHSPDGRLRFLGDKHLYDVCGLSLEIEDMLNAVPTMVDTTLLPFRNRIVYAMTIMEYPIHMGEDVLEIMRDGINEAFDAGRIVTNAQQFAVVVPQAKEAQIEREAQAMIDKLEQEQDAVFLAEDQHEGVLAGLSYEEREAAIDEYYRSGALDVETDDELDDELDDVPEPSEYLKQLCLDGPVATSLDELLEHDNLPTVNDLASAFDKLTLEDLGLDATDDPDTIERFEHMKAVFAEESDLLQSSDVIASVVTDPEALYRRFSRLPAYEVAALRILAEAGGRLSVAADDNDALYDTPRPAPGLCYLFEGDGTFEFVMPDEVVPVVTGIDWDALNAHYQKRIELIHFVDAVLELRGIAPYVDVIEEYAKLYPDGYATAQEIHDEIERQLLSPYSGEGLLDTGDEVYLLHEDLAWLYLDGQGLDPYEDGGIFEGELDDMLEELLAQQDGKDARPVSSDMCGKNSIHRWREALPAMCALREYLDAHVPDTQNDYSFADDVLFEVEKMLHWGYHKELVSHYFEVLEDHDFIPTEAQVHKLIDLIMNAANSYPTWPNNGWAPNELHERMAGHKIFYNEDGSVMKVGRNDPCPCGSGKKYKKCCGAH